jgi:hypothetical protein
MRKWPLRPDRTAPRQQRKGGDHAAIKDYFVSFLKSAPVGTINTSTVKLGCNLAYRMGT